MDHQLPHHQEIGATTMVTSSDIVEELPIRTRKDPIIAENQLEPDHLPVKDSFQKYTDQPSGTSSETQLELGQTAIQQGDCKVTSESYEPFSFQYDAHEPSHFHETLQYNAPRADSNPNSTNHIDCYASTRSITLQSESYDFHHEFSRRYHARRQDIEYHLPNGECFNFVPQHRTTIEA